MDIADSQSKTEDISQKTVDNSEHDEELEDSLKIQEYNDGKYFIIE